jgi:phosphatidylethanolamine/phosphatidyl-N-methylethanolamine N-methyltransferase
MIVIVFVRAPFISHKGNIRLKSKVRGIEKEVFESLFFTWNSVYSLDWIRITRVVNFVLKEHLVMLQGSIEQFATTGTICGSSPWAAKALSEPMLDIKNPIRIIEVGAGTGTVTAEIIRRMKSTDHLTIVEINPKFMRTLKDSISKLPEYAEHAERIEFFEGPVQEVCEAHSFDLIICALPFLNFDRELTESILNKLNRLAAPNAIMTHFEYMALGKLGSAISKRRRERFNELRSILHSTSNNSKMIRKNVWKNVFPMYVYTTKLPFTLNKSNGIAV